LKIPEFRDKLMQMLEAKRKIESEDRSSFVSSVIVPSGLPIPPGTFVVASLATFRDLSTPSKVENIVQDQEETHCG
jgi:hypothetical protein